MIPSVWAHTLGGSFLLAAVLLSALNVSKLKSLSTYSILKLLLMLSVVITLHGISHAVLEKQYGYNPWRLFM